MTTKTLLGVGMTTVAVLLLAFGVLRGLDEAFATKSAAAQKTSPEASNGGPPQPAGAMPSGAIPVTPQDMEKLAQMVDLTESPDQGYKKEKWAKAIPVAEKLLQQSCDCEQRNWLTQFVKVGRYALSGAPEYREFAPMLATMYRDNEELVTGLPSD